MVDGAYSDFFSQDVRKIMEKWEKEENRPPNFYEKICGWGRRIFGPIAKNLEIEEETLEKISWSGYRITPTEWWSGFLLVFSLPIAASGLALVPPILMGKPFLSLLYIPVLGFATSFCGGVIFYYYPYSVADIEKSDAQSKAILTTMLFSFALYHHPNLRKAMVFAADSSEGKLADDLQKGLLEMDQQRSYKSASHLLTTIATNWKDIDEGTRRALFAIIRSTGEKEEASRRQDIAKAPELVLQSAEQDLKERLNSLILPTMTFLMFGSLAVIGVIGLSPLFGMVGLGGMVDVKFFLLVSAAIILAFYAFTVFIGSRRPAIIPPPKIPSEVFDIPPMGRTKFFGRTIPVWVPACLAGTLVSVPGVLYYCGYPLADLNTLWFVWGVAGGIAVYGYLKVEPWSALRERSRLQARDWGLALNTVGSRMVDGAPMKEAMLETADIMPKTEVGDQLERIASIMEDLAVDSHFAIFETNLNKEIYSPLVTSFLKISTRIRKNSEKAAGKACMMAADFLDTLWAVKRRFKDKITDATNNLWMMSILLLPLVCALSVWVMDFMSEVSMMVETQASRMGMLGVSFFAEGMETVGLMILKLDMGITAVLLSLVVTRYIAVIKAGDDSLEFWETVPKTVLISAAVFTISYLGLGLLKING